MIVSKHFKKESLTIQELKQASITMADAFQTHERMTQIFTNKRSLELMFYAMLYIINREGDILVLYDYDKPIGYLTFMKPQHGKEITLWNILKYVPMTALKFFFVSIKDLGRIMNYLSEFSQIKEIEGKNIHLMQAAIDPSYKGQGMMSELFKLATEHYKNYDNITLETSDSSNISLYKHLGYEVVQTIGPLHVFKRKLEE